MVALSVLSSLVLAASAVAIPTGRERLATRLAKARAHGQLPQPYNANVTFGALTAETPHSNIMQDDIWAGPSYTYPSGSIKSVTATWVVNKPSIPPGGDSSTAYAVSPWVGIDGISCGGNGGLWQAGLDYDIQGTNIQYNAWFEWYPQGSIYPGTVPFKAGDTVTVVVSATSKTTGTAKITNVTTGKSVSQSLTNMANPLCQQNVEWIVEKLSDTLPNFGTVKFTNTLATLTSGATIGSKNADVWQIVDGSGKAHSATTLVSDGTATVAYE